MSSAHLCVNFASDFHNLIISLEDLDKTISFTPVPSETNWVRMSTSNDNYSYIMFDNISLWVTDTGYVP